MRKKKGWCLVFLLWAWCALANCAGSGVGTGGAPAGSQPVTLLDAELGLPNLGGSCFLNALLQWLSVPDFLPFWSQEVDRVDPGSQFPDLQALLHNWLRLIQAQAESHHRVDNLLVSNPQLLSQQVSLASQPSPLNDQKRSLLLDLSRTFVPYVGYSNTAVAFLSHQIFDPLEALSEFLAGSAGWSVVHPLAVFKPGPLLSLRTFRRPLPLVEEPGAVDAPERVLEIEDPAFPVALFLNALPSEGGTLQACVDQLLRSVDSAPGDLWNGTAYRDQAFFVWDPRFGLEVPPFVVLHLQRRRNPDNQKLSTPVAFLAPFQLPYWVYSQSAVSPLEAFQNLSALASGDLRFVQKNQSFQVVALVLHQGPLVGGGHYRALIRQANGDWTWRDDHQVTLIPQAALGPGHAFYEAAMREAVLILGQAVPEGEP